MDYYRQLSKTIFDIKKGDVNGDGIIDTVYIVGSRNETLVINDISVVIKDGMTDKLSEITLDTNKGYNPNLFLGDFSGNKVDDIFISIESGNTGLENYNYIYSYLNNQEKLLFDYNKFNQKYKYDVIYKDNYKVDVISRFDDTKFNINIRDKKYLNQIYDNGNLIKPLNGYVSPIITIRPIYNSNKGHYNIDVIQRIIGYYNADILGVIETHLELKDDQFILIDKPHLV